MNDKQNNQHHDLKNADFLVWRAGNYQRAQRDKKIKNIFYTRARQDDMTKH